MVLVVGWSVGSEVAGFFHKGIDDSGVSVCVCVFEYIFMWGIKFRVWQ